MSSKYHKTLTDCESLPGCPDFMLGAYSHLNYASRQEKVIQRTSFLTPSMSVPICSVSLHTLATVQMLSRNLSSSLSARYWWWIHSFSSSYKLLYSRAGLALRGVRPFITPDNCFHTPKKTP
ncbi:hypothetical protein DPMN_122548 [Dreissena polymorpha]|uniref:Uncharacterized protein n=1 Tax=Dreissena polymorpha TaxID=45954 RepID=A0A9D4GSQ4_DREPO|nr:hypothetical protein DPMN_122548 [Dreissena polymorpha]